MPKPEGLCLVHRMHLRMIWRAEPEAPVLMLSMPEGRSNSFTQKGHSLPGTRAGKAREDPASAVGWHFLSSSVLEAVPWAAFLTQTGVMSCLLIAPSHIPDAHAYLPPAASLLPCRDWDLEQKLLSGGTLGNLVSPAKLSGPLRQAQPHHMSPSQARHIFQIHF